MLIISDGYFVPQIIYSQLIVSRLCSILNSYTIHKSIQKMPIPVILIHGGAGTINRDLFTPEKAKAYSDALRQALEAGNNILSNGGSALDAVEAAVIVLEDCPLFNAGRGAVFTHTGEHELDAAIMSGKDKTAGAVAGIKNIKNPIQVSRLVMERSEHVLLCSEGALEFAQAQGIPTENNNYFYNQMRYEQWQQALIEDKVQLDHTEGKKFGTVGAVACDIHGNIAAATSTGGMTNKKWGRVGDSPLIGAGTYADNNTCAVSCTGHGEYFIRSVVAYDISCLMEYKNLSLQEAAHIVVQDKLKPIGGEGGLIAVDAQGNFTLPYNSDGMYRGWQRVGEQPNVAVFEENL